MPGNNLREARVSDLDERGEILAEALGCAALTAAMAVAFSAAEIPRWC
jgi:hypothetical protein